MSETMNTSIDKAVSSFVKKMDAKHNFTSVSKNLTYKDFLSNKMLLVKSIREGVPYQLFVFIKNETPFNEDEWANFLNISKKSLQRYHVNEDFVFKPIHSEKIFEIAEVTELGKEVFGDMKKFTLWLQTPSYALGNMKPLQLLHDSYGKELIINELHRIDHGIFA